MPGWAEGCRQTLRSDPDLPFPTRRKAETPVKLLCPEQVSPMMTESEGLRGNSQVCLIFR
jgi:hypothetical protein